MDFLSKLGPGARSFIELMNVLPQIGFYITDTKGRLILLNRKNFELCNISPDIDVSGMSYRDFFPEVMSAAYDEFDASVRKAGSASLRKVVFCQASGTTLPIVLNNFPLRSRNGTIIGTMGAYYQAEEDWSAEWVTPIKTAIDHIREHYAEDISIERLARLCRTSIERFRRHFMEQLGVPPEKFLINFRINKAKQLLEETSLKLSDIAVRTGFYDQSHFTKAFKQSRGVTPGAYRKGHWQTRG